MRKKVIIPVIIVLAFWMIFYIPNLNSNNSKYLIEQDCSLNIDTSSRNHGDGCGNAFLYKSLKEGVLTLNIEMDSIGQSYECRKSEFNQNISAILEIYSTNEVHYDSIQTVDYCSCFKIANAQKRTKLNAIEGTVTFLTDTIKSENGDDYRISAQLDNLRFINPTTKDTIKFKQEYFWNVKIGWKAG